MAIRSVKTGLFSRSMLVGNSYYIPPAFDSIATATGTGSSDTITFSNIPQTYKHLQVRILGREGSSGANYGGYIKVQYNGVTSSTYSYHRLKGNGTSVSSSGTSTGDMFIELGAATNGSLSNVMGVAIFDLHDYASTSKTKVWRSFAGVDNNDGSTNYGLTISSGFLSSSTSAITSLSFIHNQGNWTTSSKIALYGIGVA